MKVVTMTSVREYISDYLLMVAYSKALISLFLGFILEVIGTSMNTRPL